MVDLSADKTNRQNYISHDQLSSEVESE
uniref:Uncharacterized protein n=1 Tax=Schistosoma haematobium TaxID=6185 RepID=A0A094ZNW6_SCHHA